MTKLGHMLVIWITFMLELRYANCALINTAAHDANDLAKGITRTHRIKAIVNSDTLNNISVLTKHDPTANNSLGKELPVNVQHKMHLASWNFEHVKDPFIIAVFLLAAGIAKLGFHHADFLSSTVPESCLLIIMGTIVGAIISGVVPVDEKRPELSADLFFLYLLPPIILESAYSLHDRTFYDNVGTVMIYAVLGTVLNCFLIGPSLYAVYKWGAMGDGMPRLDIIQCLVFSAIIVAVDPVAVLAIFQEVGVNNTLYFLVFGESLFNDGVTVVLYNMMKTLNVMEEITADQVILGVLQFFVVSMGGLVIGILFGALTAIVTKYTEHCRVVEPLAVFVLAYISYLMAEMVHFSGIISIICCGLTQAQYAFHNISRKSYTTVKYFSKMMSTTCDCIIFMFLGISLFKRDVLDLRHWHAGFILWTLFFCFIYRFLGVFLLTYVLNRCNRVRKIDMEEQFIMAYGGLRGAVAFSLVGILTASNLPVGHFLTTTVTLIFFTVFIQGGTIKPLVKLLRVKMEETQKLMLSEEINSHVTDHVMAGIEEITGQRGEHYFREMIEFYNRRYLKVWLQRVPVSVDEQIMKYFEKLTLRQHFEQLSGCKMIIDKYGKDEETDEHHELQAEDEFSDRKDSVDGGGDIVIEMSSLTSNDDGTESELESEFVVDQADIRRKSLFPVVITKDVEDRLNINPTAQDLRKIMVPSRRQMQFIKLDKNLKSDNSENDLLKYLQNKQLRTHRVSQAIWNQPINERPEIRDLYTLPSKSHVDPATLTNNYRRRLSLVPTVNKTPESTRRRGASVGNVLKGLDTPTRKRLKFKKRGTYSVSSDDKTETSCLCLSAEIALQTNGTKNVNFCLESPEKDDEVFSSKGPCNKPASSKYFMNSPVHHSSLKKLKPIDELPPQLSLDSAVESHRSEEKHRGGSNMTKCTSVGVRSSKAGIKSSSSSKAVRTSEKAIKFISPKNSPSFTRKRKMFIQSNTKSLEASEDAVKHEHIAMHEILSDSKLLHKSRSYSKALSVDMLDD